MGDSDRVTAFGCCVNNRGALPFLRSHPVTFREISDRVTESDIERVTVLRKWEDQGEWGNKSQTNKLKFSAFRNINIFKINYLGNEKFHFTTLDAPESLPRTCGELNIGRTGYSPRRQRRNREGSTKILGSLRRKSEETNRVVQNKESVNKNQHESIVRDESGGTTFFKKSPGHYFLGAVPFLISHPVTLDIPVLLHIN